MKRHQHPDQEPELICTHGTIAPQLQKNDAHTKAEKTPAKIIKISHHSTLNICLNLCVSKDAHPLCQPT